MTTKYNVGDLVFVKFVIDRIGISKDGVTYHLTHKNRELGFDINYTVINEKSLEKIRQEQ